MYFYLGVMNHFLNLWNSPKSNKKRSKVTNIPIHLDGIDEIANNNHY
jgi:hypothetical protein